MNIYLADINEQAEKLFFPMVKQFADKKGITEELKSTDQMNNIQARVRDIVEKEIIYA